MKADTIERNGEKIKRQLEIDKNIYQAADELLDLENKQLGKVSRLDKKFLNTFLPELIGDGVLFRKGKIFTPIHLINKLSRDEKWIKLMAKAQATIEELRKYEEKVNTGL